MYVFSRQRLSLPAAAGGSGIGTRTAVKAIRTASFFASVPMRSSSDMVSRAAGGAGGTGPRGGVVVKGPAAPRRFGATPPGGGRGGGPGRPKTGGAAV